METERQQYATAKGRSWRNCGCCLGVVGVIAIDVALIWGIVWLLS